jgi:putative ABC transport system ATP-binding protein
VNEPILVARGLRKRFGPTEALRGVDIALEAGETVAVTGPSGSGKSTLLYCLSGILQLDDLREHQRCALRRQQFGFVLQFGQLVPELSAIENVALPLLLDSAPSRRARVEALQWLERLGAAAVAGARPGELSGGQAQRVAIARALVARPAVVFADEPTGALDSMAADEVMTVLTDAARAEGTTLLVVTHEPRVAAWAGREVVLRDGRVSSLGAVAR